MPRYADPRRCPDCTQPLNPPLVTCPTCGLLLVGPDASALFATLTRADELLGRLRSQGAPTSVAPTTAVTTGAPTTGGPSTAIPSITPPPLAPDAPRSGLAGLSVQRILLGLGALCLLVAALTFLVVAWSFLGVGGRTAILVALTVTAAVLSWQLLKRGLRTAAEALATVALGLLTLDLLGAENAGWTEPLFGDLSSAGLVLFISLTIGATALATAVATLGGTHRLLSPEIIGALAVTTAGIGLAGVWDSVALASAATAVALLALAQGAHRLGLRFAAWISLGGAALWACVLLTDGLFRIDDEVSLRQLWLEGDGWPLAGAAALFATPLVMRWLPRIIRVGSVSAAATIATGTVLLPVIDEGQTAAALVCLAVLAGWLCVVIVWKPTQAWKPALIAPVLTAGAFPLVVLLELTGTAAASVVEALEPEGIWSAGVGVTHAVGSTDAHPLLIAPIIALLGVAVGLLMVREPGTVISFVRQYAVPLGVLLGLALLTSAALYAVPVALLVVGLLAAAGVLAWWANQAQQTPAYGAAVVVGLAALATALPSAWLTLAVLLPAVAASAFAMRARSPIVRNPAEVFLPLVSAALLWTLAEIASLDVVWRAAPVLVCVGVLAVVQPRITLESAAAVVAVFASLFSIASADDTAVALAVHLTLAGALVTTSSLVNARRRWLGWVGGLLLAAATWVRLWDLGVSAPEAYTMPSALALAGVGLWHLRKHPEASTRLALGPALTLATVPSLLATLDDPVSWRAALLGVGCLGLVLAGVQLRWSAPVVVGAIVGSVLVVLEAAPYTGSVPPWVLIGLAGVTLVGVGITWESRLRNIQSAAAYVAQLR